MWTRFDRTWSLVDDIYNRPSTPRLRTAQALGFATADSPSELVNQVGIGRRHWTGLDAVPAVLRPLRDLAF